MAGSFEDLGEGLMFNNPDWSPWVDKKHMTKIIKDVVYRAWPGLDDFLDTLIIPPLKLDEDPPDIYETLNQMRAPLEAIMTMVLSGEFGYFKMYHEAIKTEYYEEMLNGDLDRLCFIFCMGCSKYMLSKLLYHIDRKFIPQFLKNMLIKPNLQSIIDKCKKSIFVKTTMEKEQEGYAKMSDLIFTICQNYMINQDYEAMEVAMLDLEKIEVAEKAEHVKAMVESLNFFVPEFFVEALQSEHPRDVLMYDERMKKFTYDMLRAHHLKTLEDLCLKYGNPRERKMDMSRIANLHLQRKDRHNLMYCPEVDGLSYEELRILDRLRKNQLTENDMKVVNRSQNMLNIKAVMDKEVAVGDVVDIDDLTMTITKKDGSKKVYNYGDKTFKYRYNDALRMLFDEETAVAVRKMANSSMKNKLKTTGITIKEQMDAIGNLKPFDTRDMSVQQLLDHREAQIEKLIKESPIATKLRIFRNSKLGTPEHPKLEYLTVNDLLNEMTYLVEDDPTLLCYKLIELEQLDKFVAKQDSYIAEGIKMDIEKARKMDNKIGKKAYDEGYKRLDFGDITYIANPDPDPFDIDRKEIIKQLQEENQELKTQLEEIKKRRTNWLKVPKITGARL